MPVGAHVIPAQVVDDDHEEVGSLVGLAALEETEKNEKGGEGAESRHSEPIINKDIGAVVWETEVIEWEQGYPFPEPR